MKTKKKHNQGTEQALKEGLIKESQLRASHLDTIVADMRNAKANGTFTPGMIDLDFHEAGCPLGKSIDVACQVLEIAADTQSVVAMTFPSPHPIVRFEAELRRLHYCPVKVDDIIAASAKDGWVMYSVMTQGFAERGMSS